MARYLGWLANSVCFVLCCFFAASTVNAVIGSALGSAPDEGVAPTEIALASAPSWDDRQVIVGRNLFNASLLAPANAATIEEDLEATRLPLTLLGTVYALEPENAWAAIEERDTHVNRVVRVNDEIRPGATVLRIERRRVVLMENGAQRELALAEDEIASAVGVPPPRPRVGAQGRTRRELLAMNNPPGGAPPETNPPAADPNSLRNPATLFSQARILPKYANGQMVGVQVNAIKPGSLFEAIGIKNGCVIREMNGIKIDSPEQSAKILLELVDAKRFDIVVDECQGATTLSYTPTN
jgi:general secretion pathway protein C